MDASSHFDSVDLKNSLSLDVGFYKEGVVRPDDLDQALASSRALRPMPLMAGLFSFTLKKRTLKRFKKLYDIPNGVVLDLPEAHKQACAIGVEEICLYEQTLESDLHFPVTLFIRELLNYVSLASA